MFRKWETRHHKDVNYPPKTYDTDLKQFLSKSEKDSVVDLDKLNWK